MAKVSFSSLGDRSANRESSNQVSFFNLQNDGDWAIVRFIEDSVDDFEILTTHPITINGKYRSVSCIREAEDPMDKCPLCAAGLPIHRKFFIRMIQYSNENGTIVAKPVVWERSLQYAYTLKEYLESYGPLSQIICKITRHGAAGSMQTRYEISPNLNKAMYRDDMYPCDTSAFENYSVLGTVVLEKNASDMQYYLANKSFPRANNGDAAPRMETAAPVNVSPAYTEMNSYNQMAPAATAPAASQRMPWETPGATSAAGGAFPMGNSPVSRPERYY